MSKASNQEYLLSHQYKDESNLNARVQLHARFSANKYGWHRWLFDHLKLSQHSLILELGCGQGNLWFENLDRIPDEWDITLSDFSPGMLAATQRNLAHSQRRFRFERVDAQSIPFDDKSFDVVIANHMLFHVPDKPQALSEIRRVLKPDGCLYASTIGQTHMKELGELVHTFDPALEASTQSFTLSFTLENGHDQLAASFSKVTLHRYEDALVVTEAAPVVDYILSGFKDEPLLNRREAFLEFVEQRLARHGSLHVTKASGLFEAS